MVNSLSGRSLSFNYDEVGRVKSIRDVRFSYDYNGRLIKTILPSGLRANYAYDAESRLSTISPNWDIP